MSDNAYDTWSAPPGWEPPKRARESVPTVNPLRELRQHLGKGGFTAVPESTVVGLMCHDAMPDGIRLISETIADASATRFRLRVDLGLPGPEYANDRLDAAMNLRQQAAVLSLVSAIELRDGLDQDGYLTLPPLERMDALAAVLQIYDLGLDVTLDTV